MTVDIRAAVALLDGEALPTALILLVAGVLGALIGSFLNVVIWRVPRGESIVRPGSACPQCGRAIAWYDNLPVVSYLVLRGRCRHCATHISARYPLVELGTGIAFAIVVWGALVGTYPAAILPLLLYWASIGIALALIDLDHHRLPNVITLPAYIVTAVLAVAASVLLGEYGRLLTAAAGFALLGGFYLLLAVAYRGGMGLGDVKLAGSLGLLLGWLGWPQLVVGGFSAFVIGGIVGVVLMVAGRAGRKSRLPFGPFMLLGSWVGVFAGPAIAGFYLSATGLA
ncbi:prepilin peptidase [Microbacterium sp. zg.Y1090]|uniref:prepilin peptidase n=1 Tax=Microbacterium TaxID=33882 RepID=UPI00214B4B1E|nr:MULTISPECIES: A24 family peptidase [unclassified Microbacterium]MCR2814138.1 prepilin peptidase [Microbacterium sp. zg.Y1084]MCR2819894.1 prepilin peptidase [Microbacterium sp. zg.Y1090]WIM27481.1 prepilin peptidase [Microbacterium sp. zg-Y1090]